MKNNISRRTFIQKSLAAGAGLAAINNLDAALLKEKHTMKFGLVTYLWAQDWDLPTLLSNCKSTGYHGIELRTQHAHKVEINLNAGQRAEVRRMFSDAGITCIGYGSNFEYHSPDAAELRKNIDQTKEYIKLCRDIGATGIKVKPNDLPAGVPKEKTIAQIAAALNEIGKFASDYGQLVRVEVHGNKTQDPSVMRSIFDQVTASDVKICWNSNDIDLLPPGLEANFNLLKKWFGDTVHVRELNGGDYPYQQLFDMFKGIGYEGWILLEARTNPPDRVAAMKEQIDIFRKLTNPVNK